MSRDELKEIDWFLILNDIKYDLSCFYHEDYSKILIELYMAIEGMLTKEKELELAEKIKEMIKNSEYTSEHLDSDFKNDTEVKKNIVYIKNNNILQFNDSEIDITNLDEKAKRWLINTLSRGTYDEKVLKEGISQYNEKYNLSGINQQEIDIDGKCEQSNPCMHDVIIHGSKFHLTGIQIAAYYTSHNLPVPIHFQRYCYVLPRFPHTKFDSKLKKDFIKWVTFFNKTPNKDLSNKL
tara:strand:+ start:887 stop:1597 length:711 start_codon:yes stop_codon:yes gene_type:complete